MPPEQAAHLFQRFYRLDGGRSSGSGLGLAIARELAELMGGSSSSSPAGRVGRGSRSCCRPRRR